MAEARWPQAGAVLRPPDAPPRAPVPPPRVFLDAGHGAPGNAGSTTVDCTQEQEHTLRLARGLGQALEGAGYEVRLSREDHQGPGNVERVEAAATFEAEVLLSVHTDVRGEITLWQTADGLMCPRNDSGHGFAVLVSEEASGPLLARRLALARSLARHLVAVGLPPYDGADYEGLYELDEVPGVFLDRRGLAVLRRPVMPSVILETHHGLHLEEHLRWQEPATLAAFHGAVLATLAEVLPWDEGVTKGAEQADAVAPPPGQR